MGGLSELIEKHPVLIFAAVAVVVVIAYAQSRNNSASSGDVGFSGGGVAPMPSDPNLAATEQARISATQSEIGTLASYLVATQQSSDALSATLAQTRAAEDVGIAQTSAARDVGLAQTAASVDIAGIQTNGAVSIANTQAEESLAAAKITADTQSKIIDSNISIAQIEASLQQQLGQFQKDIARAGDNTSIFGSILGGIGYFLGFV